MGFAISVRGSAFSRISSRFTYRSIGRPTLPSDQHGLCNLEWCEPHRVESGRRRPTRVMKMPIATGETGVLHPRNPRSTEASPRLSVTVRQPGGRTFRNLLQQGPQLTGDRCDGRPFLLPVFISTDRPTCNRTDAGDHQEEGRAALPVALYVRPLATRLSSKRPSR